MSGLFFLLFFLSITSLFLFEVVYISITREDVLKIEIHFVFFVLLLKEKREEKKRSDISKDTISRSVLRLFRTSQIEIRRLAFHRTACTPLENFESYYRYRALAGVLLTLVYKNSEELSVPDDFFTVNFTRTAPPTFDVNIRTYVFDALVALSPLLLSLITKKRKRINA